MILSLPFSLPDATPIGDRYAIQTRDGITYYFFNLEPFDCHPAADRRATLLRAAKLHVVSGVPQADIMAAFYLSRPTVARVVKRYREHGEDAFFAPRRGRGRTVVDPQMAAEAAKLLASGMSGSACARHLGIPASTFNENRRAGVIAAPAPALAAGADAAPAVAATALPASAGAPQTDPAAATDRATRDARDKHAPMCRAARDVERRTLASAGLLTEATPRFAEPAHAVARGGVLAALPMLLCEGLLGAANRLFRLPAGGYGLSTILLFVACMTLARVRNPEALRYQAPGEWGAILGLDRCPEPKTLRRKLRLLASAEHTVRDWQAELARSWASEHDDDWATLAVDGHVKVYAGRNGRLPKHFVARQKLCLPASVSYWINALGGAPLLCLHQALDPKLVKALEHDVVPHLLQLGVIPEAAPDLTGPDAEVPSLTLVFDREGWSPDLFKRLARRGVACITWHKNFKGEDWPPADFRTLEVPLHGPAGTSTSTVTSPKSRSAAQRAHGRDSAYVANVAKSTDHHPPTDALGAGRRRHVLRWSQENFFKYLRESSTSTLCLPMTWSACPTHRCNPVRRALEKTIRRVRSRLAAARTASSRPARNSGDRATRLEADAKELATKLDQLKHERTRPPMSAPATCPTSWTPCRLAHDCSWSGADDRLSRRDPHDGAGRSRRLLRALLTSAKEPAPGILRVHLGLGNDACDRKRNSTRPARSIQAGLPAADSPLDVSSDSG